jgi:hypothetical protein
MDRKTVFIIALVYLSVILILALVFFIKRSALLFLPESFGPVPLGVPWFGALGAVLISLTGVFEHEHDWDPGYWPWHLSRPLIGVGLGVVSVMILKAGILAVGSVPQPQQSVPTNLLYYLVAFLVGYREETFRELIKRLVDVILSSGRPAGAVPTIHVVNPSDVRHDLPSQVVVSGSGFTSTRSVRFGNLLARYTINSDGQLTATTPALPAAGPVPLTVITNRGSATREFTFT